MERTISIARLVAASLLAWSVVTSPALASAQSESFDKPIKETIVDLGVSPYYADTGHKRHGQLRCHYFPTFMVKELDWGQKGDDQVSFAPNDPARLAPCTQDQVAGEGVIPGEDAVAGYFGGVKGSFVFLEAADCSDRGCPFGVFEPFTGKKLFEDMRRLSPKGKIAEIRFAKIGQGLVMRYPRVVPAGCSIPQKRSQCWNEILRTTGLTPRRIPKCIGYSGFNRQEGYGTGDLRDPSVVSFPVEVTIPEFRQRIIPGTAECWAAD